MELSRRRMLQLGMLGVAGTAVGATAACGSSSSSGSKTTALSLWYWGGGLSDKVVADAVTHFPDFQIKAQKIDGDFKQKLITTMAGGKFVPDITGIKGEDIASFLPNADRFVDLNTLGADKLHSQYLEWKWKQATSKDGKVVGFPIDIGPTGMYYRADLFAQAGLPTDPAQVAPLVDTWDGYFEVGQRIHKALPKTVLINNIGSIFSLIIGQGTTRFIDASNHFIGDGDHIKTAWDTSVKALTLGLDAKINDESWKQAIGNGTLATEVGAAWHALDISDAAPQTSGKWRVAPNPGGPANQGGSFLAIPKTSGNPAAAFQVITWLLSPANDARGFTDAALFPATPDAYALPALTTGDPFFGGQKTIEVFGPQAQKIPVAYEAPADAAVSGPYYSELTNVETGKDPEKAFADAVSQAKQIARRQGVN